MVVKSAGELKRYVMEQSRKALEDAAGDVFELFDMARKDYYSEFQPRFYHRTRQLYNSLTRTDLASVPGGWKASIYFDPDKMHYEVTAVSKRFEDSHNLTGKQVLALAAHGSHGGYVEGTAIWDEPMQQFIKPYAVDVFIRNGLERNGLPLKG